MPDAARAPVPDAAPVWDAGPAPDAWSGGGGTCVVDEHEPSDVPATAAVVPLDLERYGDTMATADAWMYGSLCSGDEDWYLVPASEFPFLPRDVRVRLLARDIGWCGTSCGDIELLPAPENTVFVEIYDRSGTVLHAGFIRENGDVHFYFGAPAGDDDFYLRVYGPAEAVYPYRIYISITNVEGEGECDC